MKQRFSDRFKLSVLLLILFVFVQGCASSESQTSTPFVLTIAHLNDTHAQLEPSTLKITFNGTATYTEVGGFPAVTAKIKQLRQNNENFLFLHAGDVFQGTLYFLKYRGMAPLAFLKLMKLDAMCAGNHEFDEGPEVLAAFIDETRGQFPVLSANISVDREPLLAGKIKPYEIKTFGSRRVGIIGLTAPDTPAVSNPGKHVVFSDPLKALKTAAAELTRKEINIIIVLSHLGFEDDIEMAKTIAGIDVVVGGHTHTLMGDFENVADLSAEAEYPYVVRNSQQETVLVVQAWEKSKALGILNVQFDNAGKVVGYSGHPVILTGCKAEDFIQKNSAEQKEPVDNETFKAIVDVIESNPTLEMIPGDPEALALLDTFSGPIRELKRAVIGLSEADLWNVRQPGDTHETAGRLENGSLIAPVVAEALLWKAKSLKNKNTQIVIQNAGSVRGDIPKGDVTIGQVYELLPFGNTLVLFDLEGSKIKEVLKAALVKADGAFPYTAGLRYSVDLSQPNHPFLKTVEVQTGKGWVPLKDDETYHIAANYFIASGKDDYTIFGEVKDKDDTGYTAAEIFIEYVRTSKTLKRPENRVTVTRSN